ncbi:hypothetical protein PNEG_01007 [Pneumocystis murina B123]|uniref:BRCT domain-containing protein n=1 Tax=Pneumocystis murina (strain B123) TaxID=1069680 RepID=M7NUT2_PNEMU|nr:hypothetical protein PNEG_01007 [Pneumocystis murina B123]EMR10861.1 hypothetical protein PNEG_01007 [Pneumocystis murina B123]
MSDQLNNGLKPLSGFVICCTSILSEIRVDLALKVLKLGAIYVQDLTSQVTHLIAGKLNTQKYKYVAMYRVDVKIMHIDWIFDIYKQWLKGDDISLLEYEKRYILPPFYNLLICVTNISIEHREEIEQKVIDLGGKYTRDLTRDTTHLITSNPTGKKYEFGVKWGIKIITPEWFWQSIERGACLEERLFDVHMAPNEVGKGAWFPAQENEKDEDKQISLKRRIKKIKLDLSHQVWNNIVNEGNYLENNTFKDNNDFIPIHTTPEMENSKVNGMFRGLYFYAWAFDNRKTEILQNIIKSHDGTWCKTIQDFPDEPVHIYIIVSHDLPRSKFIDIPRGFFVTEWWIERCLHNKKFIDPSEHLLCSPLPCDFPLEDMKDFSICLTGFSGIDLMHISKLIVLLGANYYESLNKKRNLLIYNINSEKSKKYIKAKDWNIRIVSQNWLWEVVKQGNVINFDEWEKKNEFENRLDGVETNNYDDHQSKILAGSVLYFYSIKETTYMNEMLILARKLGAKISKRLDNFVTHIICDEYFLNINEQTDIFIKKCKVVSSKWLLECQKHMKRLDEQDFSNIRNIEKIIKDFGYENLDIMEGKYDIKATNMNYLPDLLKDNSSEKRKKEKIKGRSTSLSIISTNTPIISSTHKNDSDVFNKNKIIQSEYVKYEDFDALYEKMQVLEKLNKI